ncbi:MAG: trigger factor [Candidatus Krumholzibacteria bacterium]|jgi:trigger factor|nr:trigger factor [Candidatus Krumholzibacteria bacterium]MDP7021708.1 trigger factor [Candidatus Krumholzibacteria bacterium]
MSEDKTLQEPHAHDHPPLVELESVDVKETKNWQREVSVSLPCSEWEKARKQAAVETLKSVELPGFRKGKAPADLVEKQFGPRIDIEAVEWLLPRAWHQASHDLDFVPINDPEFSDIDFGEGKSFTFKATVELRPEIQIKGTKGMKVTWYKEKLPEDACEQTLTNIREERADFILVEREAADGDRVTADFRQMDESGLPIVGTEVKDHVFELGNPMILEDFSKGMSGMKAEDERSFPVKYPEDFGNEELAGTTRSFHATLQRVEEKKLPELNDEFAKALGDFESLEQLRDRIQKNMEMEIEGRNRERLDASLVQSALAKNDFEVPPSMITGYVEAMIREQESKGQEIPETEKEEARKNLRSGAEFAIKRWFLLDTVGKQEALSVSDEEYQEHLGKLAELEDSDLETVEKGIENAGAEGRIRDDLKQRKVLDYLMDQAKVKEEDIPESAPQVGAGAS